MQDTIDGPIQVAPIAGALGAELSGIDLSRLGQGGSNAEADANFKIIHDALMNHGVIFFRNQTLTREAQLSLARRFGRPEVHPIANGMQEYPEVIRVLKPAGENAYFGTSWHTDNSFFEEPSSLTVLYGDQVPPVGGDTVWASMETAYEHLSDSMKTSLANLYAVHSAREAYDPRTTGDARYTGDAAIAYTFSESIYEEVVHPVIRVHPETGRKSIYVNPMFTQQIVGLTPAESDSLLNMLYAHSTRLDFTCRYRWQNGSVAIWDNRCVQHYAIDDYPDFDRIMYRVTICGDRPTR
jgi:taurine dioxygenase